MFLSLANTNLKKRKKWVSLMTCMRVTRTLKMLGQTLNTRCSFWALVNPHLDNNNNFLSTAKNLWSALGCLGLKTPKSKLVFGQSLRTVWVKIFQKLLFQFTLTTLVVCYRNALRVVSIITFSTKLLKSLIHWDDWLWLPSTKSLQSVSVSERHQSHSTLFWVRPTN